MTLWTFVLLGFLAQVSNGAIEIRSSVIAQELNSKMSEALYNLKGSPLIKFATDPSANLNVKDIGSVAVDSGYNNGNKWYARFKGFGFIGSSRYMFDANAELDFVVENRSPVFKWQPDKSSITLNLQTPVNGLLSSRSLTTTNTDIDQLLLISTIQQASQSAIDAVNLQFQKIRNPVTYLGNIWNYEVQEIQHLTDSVVFYEDVAIKTADGVNTYSLYTPSITSSGLPAERSYEMLISDNTFLSITEMIKFNYKRTLTEDEFKAHQIFPEVAGPKMLEVKQNSPAAYTASDSRVTYIPHVYIYDKPGNLLLESEIVLKIKLRFARKNGSFWLSANDLEITKTTAVSSDSRCRCGNDPVPYIQSLISSSITDAMRIIQCSLESPFPDPIPFDFLPTESTCSNAEGVTTCGA